jgi:(S)-2-hydroxyglutarate dehydrogenase
VVVGAGLIGLATALALIRRVAGGRVVVLDKEDAIARHQSLRNSGVIHSGVYYRPGSLKAQFARAGARALLEFCDEHEIAYELCGKLIVATSEEELPRLADLEARAVANGVQLRRLDLREVHEVEPHVTAVAALHLPETGVVDFQSVACAYRHIVEEQGGELRLGTRVVGIESGRTGKVVVTNRGAVETRYVVNCAGLHSDRVAALDGVPLPVRIVPFRGEYYELTPERRGLVRALVYPVPEPQFPFLGVHLTRTIDGAVHAGPNAVLSLKREGYGKRDVDLRDLRDVFSYSGFWRLAARHGLEGARELHRSLSRRAFARALQRLVPELRSADLVPAPAGVRAQALLPDGRLADDFVIVDGERSSHLLNAPSPGATASLLIGQTLAERALQRLERH